ncbi:MAG: helix-turn-helix transcriptional regulator [Bradyrhizobiaceae bacterium]|nr:helix-turn-helix transcriptional regulator [Bradyrhizobiaceae bacterium]
MSEPGRFERGVGWRIAYFRRRAGLSQDALAKKLGVSRSTVARFEDGKVPMTRLPQICEAVSRPDRVVVPEDLIPLEFR